MYLELHKIIFDCWNHTVTWRGPEKTQTSTEPGGQSKVTMIASKEQSTGERLLKVHPRAILRSKKNVSPARVLWVLFDSLMGPRARLFVFTEWEPSRSIPSRRSTGRSMASFLLHLSLRMASRLSVNLSLSHFEPLFLSVMASS